MTCFRISGWLVPSRRHCLLITSTTPANLRDHWLTSLTDLLDLDEDRGSDAVRSAYDSQIRGHPEVKRSRFRWILGKLQKKHDPYGCLSLARDPSLINVDPLVSGKYLAVAGLEDTRDVDAVMDCLSKPAEDLFDGLNSKADAREFSAYRYPERRHCQSFLHSG